MNNNDENLKRPQLLQLAQQRNENAIAQLLNQALAHKQITAIVKITDDHIKITLQSEQIPDIRTAKILIDRELLRIHGLGISIIQLQGYQKGAELPVWTEEFILGSQAQATQTNFSSKTTVPVEETRKKKKPYQIKFPTKPIEKAGLQALTIGFVLAVIFQIFVPLKILFNGFQVMVHEVGHALTYWLFGYPAIPSVNILYGGGITLALAQSRLILGIIYGLIAFLFYQCRQSRRSLIFLICFTVIYTWILRTPMSRMLITFMGHGMELVAITVCLYFAIGGYFCRIDIERPLYAMLGFFLFFSDWQFSWDLIFNPDFRSFYEEGIGGVIDNDFVILANDYLNVDLSIVAKYFLFGCIFTPLIAFLLFSYEKVWQSAIYSLLPSK
ncbi:MAG TPA: hypothetical protein V6D28_02540 [Leptolyngbyaceae cyanobacterium]